MSLATTKIANCPSYEAKYGNIQAGDIVPVFIWFEGRGELANGQYGKTEGLKALLRNGIPKFFNATWSFKCIIYAVQLPNATYTPALIAQVVKEVKARPNVGALYATGLSQGAIFWGQYFSGDTGTRAKDFVGCFLMSGSNISTAKTANFKNLKMILFSGSELLDTTVSPKNYETVYDVFKKAGIDITYYQLKQGHSDNVWDYFSPVKYYSNFKPYEKLLGTTAPPIITPTDNPLPPIVETQNADMSVQIIKTDAMIDGTKSNVYACGTVDVEITLPAAPAGVFNVWIRKTSKANMHFNLPLHYDETQLQTLGTPGLYRIFWNEEQKNYWVMHNV